jgi:Family of unknown function (DUF6502)
MDATHATSAALKAAVARLLRPLFRVLLRQSMSYGEFEALARRVFVDVAMSDFTIEGKKPSISRAAILSGLTRRDVQNLVTTPIETATETGERFNRAVRVMNGWLRDSEFAAADNEPRALAVDGEGGFASLVRKHAGDVPVRAVLDELQRAGAVHIRDDGLVEPAQRGYVPQRSAVDKLDMLGSDAADLIDTIDHNLQHGETAPRFQRKVMYHRVPVGLLPAFHKLSVGQSQALLERLDKWLNEHQAQADLVATNDACARIGVGIYHFEEPAAPAPSQGSSS